VPLRLWTNSHYDDKFIGMVDNINKLFGNQLKQIRRKKGLSQEELAFKVNLNRTYIGRIERGERNISLAVADRIAKALNVNIKSFFQQNK
jgi:transcriptional regulator with XRE-family HTH domain